MRRRTSSAEWWWRTYMMMSSMTTCNIQSLTIIMKPSTMRLSLLLVLVLLQSQLIVASRRVLSPQQLTRQDDRNSFLDWLLGIAGLTTTTPAPTLIPATNCKSCTCGKTIVKNRIVGGVETQVNAYPWVALLEYDKQFYCGGSLINDRYVLTAAHCTTGFEKERMSIKLLEHDRKNDNETQTITKNVARITAHPKYSKTNYNNDIALLQLDSKVDLVGTVRPVCLPVRGRSFTGFDGIVIGWGATSEGGPISDTLQEVTVPIMSNDECRETNYSKSRITDNMLCAGLPEGMKDSCQGDSGGPLHIFNKTTNVLDVVGVVSWGEGCAQPNYPGVYARVNRYITWIEENTIDACYC